ncbi:hypothetical protein HH308_14860 [Gordonia sp. TBRC 11910]|uniref:Uncharacterized protein n=1 Tax=Gordonia asplenii TaxID=2725283 RepID=A0A848KUD1_9ACTN|nr:DUF6325 family protein [Gordonia asplenii]NMO02494.1 hypothetical protein [Gordonia asplenii]
MNDTVLGPVDFFIIEFADGRVTADGFAALVDLVDRNVVYVIDIEFLRKGHDDTVVTVDAHDLGVIGGIDFADFDGAASRLLDDDDLTVVRDAVSTDAIAAIVVYEELSISQVLGAFESAGGRVVAVGPVDSADLDAALDR